MLKTDLHESILNAIIILCMTIILVYFAYIDSINNNINYDINEKDLSTTAGSFKDIERINSMAKQASALRKYGREEANAESEEYKALAESYIDGLSGNEQILNQIIYDIRENKYFSNEIKIVKVANAIAEYSDIKYESASNLFNWDNTLLDSDFEQPGCYYKNGMTFDCSGFIQYVVWIATGSSSSEGILLGRGTYFQSIEGEMIVRPRCGCLCFRYNGGSGVIRCGEEIGKNERPISDGNHVSLYIGDNKYIDCSESYGGVRIVDGFENPYYAEYFTWFRDISIYDTYTTDLEYSWHKNME